MLKRVMNKISRYEYVGFDKKVFKTNSNQINVMNQKVITIATKVSFLILAFVFFATVWTDEFSRLSVFYLSLMCVLAILISLNEYIISKKHVNATLCILYVSVISAYIFAIAIGVFGQKGNATAICVLITVMPVFILDDPIRIDCVNTIAVSVFSIMSLLFKDYDIAVHDSLNACIFTLCSYCVSYYNVKTKLEIIVANRKLKEQNERDILTKLYNRAAAKRLSEAYLRTNNNAAMIMIDIDNFKTINDTYGHDIGDEVLIEISKKLLEIFNEEDIICRLGGDEFVVFVRDVQDAKMLIPKIKKVLNNLECDNIVNDSIKINASIGIALANGLVCKYEELYSKADKAMYRSKKTGKSNYTIFEEEAH